MAEPMKPTCPSMCINYGIIWKLWTTIIKELIIQRTKGGYDITFLTLYNESRLNTIKI